jgi:hypothetical protein
MADAGLLQEESNPTPFEFADAISRLNDIINYEQTQGLKLWVNQDYQIALTPGVGVYNLVTAPGPKPLRILECYYSDVNGIRRPLNPMSWRDWTQLSQVNQQGPVNSYFVDKQISQLAISFWLIPDTVAATGSVHVVQQQQVTNAILATDTISFPQEWYIFLRWALADELATGQPQAIMDRAEKKTAIYRAALENWDVEDTTISFSPNSQMMGSYGRFR